MCISTVDYARWLPTRVLKLEMDVWPQGHPHEFVINIITIWYRHRKKVLFSVKTWVLPYTYMSTNIHCSLCTMTFFLISQRSTLKDFYCIKQFFFGQSFQFWALGLAFQSVQYIRQMRWSRDQKTSSKARKLLHREVKVVSLEDEPGEEIFLPKPSFRASGLGVAWRTAAVAPYWVALKIT